MISYPNEDENNNLKTVRGCRQLTFVPINGQLAVIPITPPALLMAYQYFFSKCNFHPTVTGNQSLSPSLTFKIQKY